MKNAKAVLFSALLSFTGAALADGCPSCPSCPSKAMVCGPEGCSIPGVEAAPTKSAKKAKPAVDATEEVTADSVKTEDVDATEVNKADDIDTPAEEPAIDDASVEDKE